MHMKMQHWQWVGLWLCVIGQSAPAAAEPISAAEARKQLFAARGVEVRFADGVPDEARDFLRQVLDLSASQNNPVPYYGALAFVPDAGLSRDDLLAAMAEGNEHLQAAGGYHAPQAAEDAALAACEAKKSEGAGPCAVGLWVLPRRYAPRDLTLSQPATRDFRQNWRGGASPKALAASPTTGVWAIAKGEGAHQAAIDACNGKVAAPSPSDCDLKITQ